MKIKKYVLLIILLLLCNNTYSDSFSWLGDDITIQRGSLSNIKSIKNIKYKFGYRSGGFGHIESAIEISWHDINGEKHKQVIFEGMVDWVIEKIIVNNSSSEIKVNFKQPCDPDPEDILQSPLIYKYNIDKKIFERR